MAAYAPRHTYIKGMTGTEIGYEIERIKRATGKSAREAADYLDEYGPETTRTLAITNGWKRNS